MDTAYYRETVPPILRLGAKADIGLSAYLLQTSGIVTLT